MAHVMLFIRHKSSWPRLTDDLCFTLYARAEQLKQLFWFITDQNKCACKVIKKSTLLLCSTVEKVSELVCLNAIHELYMLWSLPYNIVSLCTLLHCICDVYMFYYPPAATLAALLQ